jgi:serine/threonine-protein kinase RsbW
MTLQHADTPPLTVSFESRAHGLIIRIHSKGLPLDLNHMPTYSPHRANEHQETDGLSLFLASEVLDNIEFINRGRDGLEAVLLKHRAAAHIDANLTPLSSSCDTPPAWTDYTLRKAQASDSLEISRCAYLTYGHTYEDYIYYPEEITRLNQSGELYSLLAINDQQVVMGHCALKFSPHRRDQAELGVLFVRPEFRQHGLGAALWKAATNAARELGLQSIFSRSVTGHRGSQTIALENGFSDCALSLALFPRAVNLKNLGGQQPGKMSGMLQWLALHPYQPDPVFVPDAYASLVTELYHRAGLQVRRGDETEPAPNHAPLFRVQRVPTLNVAMIYVESIGPTPQAMFRWLDQAHRRLCREKIDMIYLSIILQQQGAAEIAQFAKEMGYLFSGIAPKAFSHGDALLLQYINMPETPFDNLIVWTDTAHLLRDEIQSEWRTQEIPTPTHEF